MWHEKIQPSDYNVNVRNKHAKCNQTMWYKIIHLGHLKNGEILDQENHKTWDKTVGWYKMTMKYFNTNFVSNLQVKGCIETCC